MHSRKPKPVVQRTRTEVLPSPSTAESASADQEPCTPAHSSAAELAPVRPVFQPQQVPSVATALWQGVLFVDGRATARLVHPEVQWAPAPPAEAEEQRAAVGRLSLRFSRAVPAGAAARSGGHGKERTQGDLLCLPVDELFPKRSYRVQLFGRQPGDGASFAAPHAFQAEGRDLIAALNVQRQWQQFQQRHQAARTSAGQPVSDANFAHSSTLAVQCGDGLERLQAIFDVASRPAWLKGIVCRFLVAEAPEPQPAATESVDGSGGSSGGAWEQRGATAAAPDGGADTAVAADAMAAQPAVPSCARREPGSSAVAKQAEQQVPHVQREQRQKRQPPAKDKQLLREQQHPPAHAVVAAAPPAAPATTQAVAVTEAPAVAPQQHTAAGAAAPAAAVQGKHETPGAVEGKAKRGGRHATRRLRDEAAAAASARSSRSSSGEPPCRATQPSPAHAARPGSAGSLARGSSSSSASSSGGVAAQPSSPPQGRRGNAAGGVKAQVAAQDGTEEAVPSAAAAGNSRSRSSSRNGRSSGQQATVVRRHPMLFPAAAEQGTGSPLPAVAEQAKASNSSSAATGSGTSDVRSAARATKQQQHGSAGPATSASSQLACSDARPLGGAAEQRSCRPVAAAGSAAELPSQGAGSAAARSAQAAVAGMGRGRTSRLASGAGGAPASSLPAPTTAAAAATRQQQPGTQAQHGSAQASAVGKARASKAAAALSSCECLPAPGPAVRPDSSSIAAPALPPSATLLPSAAPVWQGMADSDDIAAAVSESVTRALCAAPAPLAAQPVAPAAAEPSLDRRSSGSSTRPASAAEAESEGSVCSDGSRVSQASGQSSDSFHTPSRPSEWGVSYNYGHPSPLPLSSWGSDGADDDEAWNGQQSRGPAPHLAGRRSTGSFRHPAAGRNCAAAGRSGGGGFYAVPMPLHHAASSPVLPAPAFHQRTSSSSSSSSQGEIPSPAGYTFYGSRWQAGPRNGWPEGMAAAPQYMQFAMPHPPAFMQPQGPPVPDARVQWVPVLPPHHVQAVHVPDMYWQPPPRANSNGWQHPPPPPQRGAAWPHKPQPTAQPNSSGGQSSGRPATQVPAGSSSTPRSAPASVQSSPQPSRGPQRTPSSTPPPPPLLPEPVIDLQVPEAAEDGPDLERFLQAATPQVVPPPSGVHDLTLADLWRWYEGPSTLGCEVPTVGGPRGPATAHYLPYLSAVQLLVPASAADEAELAAAAASGEAGPGSGAPPPQLLSYPNGLDSWPERIRPVVQWGEDANMRDRVPLLTRVQELCGTSAEAHPLMATRVADLHPFSWFAVAWYPLYCVPEAPITARFLTFHTLASLWEAAREAADSQQQQQEQALAAAAAEAQRQWLQVAAQQAAAHGGHTTVSVSAGSPAPAASPPPGGTSLGSPAAVRTPGMHSRPSYKSMLAAGLQPDPPLAPVTVTYTATPTAVGSFPVSPACSDAGTRTTMGSAASRPQSVDGRYSSTAASTARSRLAISSTADSLPAGSSCGGGSSTGHTASFTASDAGSTPVSPPASVVGDFAEPLPVPVAGLAWYATGRDENWTETLVAAQLPPGVSLVPSTVLPGGARLLGSWRGMAVLSRPYPVAKGGPLGWEIQQEEMAQCAERLAAGAGLVALRPRLPAGGRSAARPAGMAWDRLSGLPAAALGVTCPDYEFFAARSAMYC